MNLDISLDQFNEEQYYAYDLPVNQRKSVLILSPGGCGKTVVSRAIYRDLRKQAFETITCAFTGRAASLLPDGTTVSRAAALRAGEADLLPGYYVDAGGKSWRGTTRTNVARNYLKVDPRWGADNLAIFIDEIGQLSSEQARLFYESGMRFRESKKKSKPPIFILTGDFGQFKPVEGNLIFEEATFSYWEQPDKEGEIILPSVLQEIELETVKLTQVMRQTDERFLRALNWLRYGIALHPLFAERVKVPTPPGTPRIFFNNKEVEKENERFIQDFLAANPKARSRKYSAVGDKLSDSDLKYLLPVQPEMLVYEGMPFTITVNVPDPMDPKSLLVANGDVVTVTRLMPRSIMVEKANGEEVELLPVQHHLPPVPGKKQVFKQLPGYSGPACSAMRVQGQTFDHPVEYGVWQWNRSKRVSLKNQPGALYVFFSRNTRLDDIYIDTSFGIEEAERLLRESIKTDEKVLEYLLEEKPPFWITDALKQWYVIEMEEMNHEPEVGANIYRYIFHHTSLQTGEEKRIHVRYMWEGQLKFLLAAQEINGEFHLLDSLEDEPAYRQLALRWYEYSYPPTEEIAA